MKITCLTLTWRSADLRPQGPSIPASHDAQDVVAGRQRADRPLAQSWFACAAEADRWVAKTALWFANLLPEQGACFAYGFTGCPIAVRWGTWGEPAAALARVR